MKKSLSWLLALALGITALTGCNGSDDDNGGGNVNAVSRVVVGYVYVEGNAGTGTPEVIISPNSTPPAGYFKPTAGTLTISVADGTITRAPDSEVFNMATSNEIICAVTQNVAPFQATVTGSGFQLNGTSKTAFTTQTLNLGTTANNGQVLAMSVGAPSYTPGAPAQVKMTLRSRDGNPGTSVNSFLAPQTATGGSWVSGNTYDVATAVFDAEGTAITGASTTLSTDDGSRLSASGALLTTAEGTGAPAADVTVTAAVNGSTLTETFTANFNYGTTTFVLTDATATTLQWDVTGGAVNSTNVTVTVENQFNAPMPGETVDFTNPGKLTLPNTWNTTAAGTCFGVTSDTTDNAGQVVTTFSTPNPVDGDLGGVAGVSGDSLPKGANTVTATSNSVVGTDTVTITRPLGAFDISGPTSRDTGTTGSYTVINAVDVDSDPVATPTVTWSVVNTAGASQIGNVGDQSLQSTAASTINASSGVLTVGNTAGETVVTATSVGLPVVTDSATVDIFGSPVKVVLTPDTSAGSILGSSGQYNGSPSGTQAFSVSLLDSWGHVISTGTYSPFTTVSSVNSASAGSITPGGVNVSGFTVTYGTSDGTFTVGINGTWTGANGGSPSVFNLTRTVGLNVP